MAHGGSSRPRARPSRLLSSLSRTSANLLVVLLLAVLAVRPVAAVKIKSFSNCLSSYRLDNPRLLQWTPIYVDAKYDTKNSSHNLQVTVWGNVTGSQNGSAVPPASDTAYWNDTSETFGKIVRVPNAELNKATTLVRKIDFLSYEPFHARDEFCGANGVANRSCPVGPVWNTSDL